MKKYQYLARNRTWGDFVAFLITKEPLTILNYADLTKLLLSTYVVPAEHTEQTMTNCRLHTSGVKLDLGVCPIVLDTARASTDPAAPMAMAVDILEELEELAPASGKDTVLGYVISCRRLMKCTEKKEEFRTEYLCFMDGKCSFSPVITNAHIFKTAEDAEGYVYDHRGGVLEWFNAAPWYNMSSLAVREIVAGQSTPIALN